MSCDLSQAILGFSGEQGNVFGGFPSLDPVRKVGSLLDFNISLVRFVLVRRESSLVRGHRPHPRGDHSRLPNNLSRGLDGVRLTCLIGVFSHIILSIDSF